MNKMTETAPKRIWLQVGDGDGESDQVFPAEHIEEITWCSAPQLADEVAYVRADLREDNEASVAAIQFALTGEDGLAFLRCWNEGNFTACRKEWPEAPAECYIGADPLLAGGNHD